MTLYTKNGCRPQELPESDAREEDGFILMPLEGYPESISECGWTPAPPAPEYNPGTKELGWDGTAWTVTALSQQQLIERADIVRTAALKRLAAVRWEHQQTFTYGDGPALSDDVTIGRIVAKIVSAQVAGVQPPPTTWKFAPGRFEPVTIPELAVYGQAIGAHVQACFDHEKQLNDALVAATTVAQVHAVNIETGWPA